jgi:glycosyltransferase involved in cell wall biosynthesis
MNKLKVTYFFRNGRLSRMNSNEDYPKDMFYGAGADSFEKTTIEELVDIKRGRYFFNILDRIFKLKLFKFSDMYSFFMIENKYDLVASLSVSMSAMRGLLNKLFRRNKKAVCFSMSIDSLNFNKVERKLFSWVQKDIIFISISRHNYEILQDYLMPSHHYFVEFGIDTDFWRMDKEVEGEYYFAIGMDKSRDWNTLIEVFKGRDERLVMISNKAHTNLSSNITHINGSYYKNSSLSDEDIRDYYKKAKAVIVLLVETGQPSGQSVCLQAMAMKKPIIITGTSGLWSKKLKDKENSFLVNIKDLKSTNDAIDFIEQDKEKVKEIAMNGYALVQKNFTYNKFVKKLDNIIESEVIV